MAGSQQSAPASQTADTSQTTQPVTTTDANAVTAARHRQEDTPPPGALSPRNASYDLDARLDPDTRTITGTGTIRWRNIGRAPADSLRLHLYWNAWRNTRSSWIEERVTAGTTASLLNRPADDWSSIDVTQLSLAGEHDELAVDLMPGFTFIQPDDGNEHDRTLAAIALPDPVVPGDTVTLTVAWTARVPRTFERTGAIGDYYFIAHWFPKLAVFEGGGWTAHQFHANTEFFSDYGVYDVRLTVPTGWVVGATGVARAVTENGDGSATHRYVQADVHDFAWTASPDFVEHRQRFAHRGLPPVEMRLLLQPEHAGQEDRHFAATAAALRYYGEWYGAYPYPQITIVDPAWQSESGGMEYPTLFTAGTRWLAPRHTNEPEAVTVHEAGHQFWYAMVANNEFEHAWMDEGINTFSEARVQAVAFQPDYRTERLFGGFIPWQLRAIALDRATDGNGLNGYRGAARRDVPATPTWQYWPGTHARITYFKTALWLHTLERHLGWDTLQGAMRTYFDRWRFRHPRPDDFFAAVSEAAGRDMSWFFDQVHRSSNVFDYGVERFESVPTESRGFEDGVGDAGIMDDTVRALYRTTAIVRRFGEATFPVDVLVRFDDGSEVRTAWEGLERWRAFTWDRPARGVSVQVDPDRVLLLDIDYTNNSQTLEPATSEASTKWALTWMVWVQDLMLTWSFFV